MFLTTKCWSGSAATAQSPLNYHTTIGPFFVRSKYQDCGAAQSLMLGVIQEARVAKIEQLELYVDTKNYRAIRFYEQQGFKRVATHTDSVRIDGTSRDDHFYCLRLIR